MIGSDLKADPRSRSSESLRKFTEYALSHTFSPFFSMTLFCNKRSSTPKLFLYLYLNTILDIMCKRHKMPFWLNAYFVKELH